MDVRPYITYPSATERVKVHNIGEVIARCYLNEPGQVSFSVIDYVPGWVIALHSHNTWELIIIDSSSDGPGYTFFGERWWIAEPGSAAFIPKGCRHAWSSGNAKGFKMLAIYGGSYQEAGRTYHVDPKTFQSISADEERKAVTWTVC